MNKKYRTVNVSPETLEALKKLKEWNKEHSLDETIKRLITIQLLNHVKALRRTVEKSPEGKEIFGEMLNECEKFLIQFANKPLIPPRIN